ncbi:FAD-binding and (Fe-S)-binding domain-containing protein [Runella slithyformis]|uniref:D-lactate dehydrogenase (Cytochrome) n=1 Tax=Runella slithyformis (strain ATCC 29530 / DSM 19594 / LMG 11500 / NCIMB 11436 / LSU 4) TaxID=761193 RepID=A0A7U3ZHU0_RUNSL|nr:FAD-binding and (Fe-S)-binding domain-containing protein [Runella slithyformis]AEI47450.1 D-lactate dehydrogenase (cytochrome) [Runella slithyformis DSM 19594]
MTHLPLAELAQRLKGELHYDSTMRTLYATDASAYREMPQAVAIPQDIDDLKTLIAFAREHRTSLIPRTAGTSLAGQVVGNGIVVDVSRTFTKILEINPEERWVRVQPGVIRDELNMALKPYGLYFGPETSTANRAMIGGMVGNNSCGSNSVVYGSTREHLLEVKALLADGNEVTFGPLLPTLVQLGDDERLLPGLKIPTNGESDLESSIYNKIFEILSDPDNQAEIRKNFPKKSVERRNTGYALDMLLDTAPFGGTELFNMCKLIAGSEGTLCFLTEIKLNLIPPPPKAQGLVCAHFNTIDEALRSTITALKYKPQAVELIDNYILECAAENPEQSKNAFFVQRKADGSFPIILVVDVSQNTKEEVEAVAAELIEDFKREGIGFHYPLLHADDTRKIWTLRKAGLGLLGNLPGDEKAVAVIEDTAVDVYDQPAYIRDFNEILHKNGMSAVHYAHAGSGEIHLRPIINLKTKEGHAQFRMIAEEIATLVKKYDGSLSGEHGDGRLRGEFIPQMVGPKNYELFKEIKHTWDPYNIFNPNKIVETPPMDTFLRYEAGQQTPEFKTYFRYPDQNVLQHAEQCNGSGDCRKTHLSGGTMCPSFMATRNEKDTTRARANVLREFLTRSDKANRFDHEEIKEVYDLCLACKGCKGECPSNVDVAKLKMEFLQQYYDTNGVPMRSWLVGNFSKMTGIASYVPWAYNLIFKNAPLRRIANRAVGFHPDRTMPLLHSKTLKQWFENRKIPTSGVQSQTGKVYLFCDEFTNYNDVEIGKKAVQLLEKLGYEVSIPEHAPSARPQLSKGLLKDAKKIAEQNVRMLRELITAQTPLIGIEPSAILTFRDEYPDLVSEELMEAAKDLAKNALQFDEFIAREMDAKRITGKQFTTVVKKIKLHGHCQQKAIASMVPTKKMLSLPKNYEVTLIPSGCCGMAGSFGYEKEHYDLSMKIGELVLFPTVRSQPEEVIIAAPGTSCRHQIHDGTGRKALHPVEILWEALV